MSYPAGPSTGCMMASRETRLISFAHNLLPNRSCRERRRSTSDPALELCRLRELDVIRLLRMTQNNAVKAAVIFKLGEHVEAKALHVHLGDRGQIIGRPSYPHRRTRLHSH